MRPGAVAGLPHNSMVTANNTYVLAYRARFRNMKVRAFDNPTVIKCEPVIELRRLSVRSKLFGIFWAKTGQRISSSGYCLRDAKCAAEEMFETKIEDWWEVTQPDPLAAPAPASSPAEQP